MFFKISIFVLSFSCLTTILSSQFNVYATDRNLNFITTDKSDSTLDTLPTVSDTLDTIATNFGFGFFINFGLGHQDQLIKRTTSIQPDFKTSSLYWSPSFEFRLSYSLLSVGVSGSLVSPLPWELKDGDYYHTEWSTDIGLLSRLRVLPWTHKINFIPTLGFRWLKETAKIYDPKGKNPDLFNLRYSSNGPMYGIEFHYSLRRKSYGDQRLIFSYVYGNLTNNNVNIYRISWGIFDFPNTALEKTRFGAGTFGFASFGIEYITGTDGRKGWFLVASVGLFGQIPKHEKVAKKE